MLSFKLSIPATAVALVLLAGAILAMPGSASAQSSDGQFGSYPDPRSDERRDTFAAPNADNADDEGGDDDDLPPAASSEDRSDDESRNNDGQDFARTDEETRCMTEFRNFDPGSGTYVNDDGDRLKCPYLD